MRHGNCEKSERGKSVNIFSVDDFDIYFMSKNFVLYCRLYQHIEHLWWPADFIEETRAKMSS